MSGEDRYTRLKSLKEFGYEVDWNILSKKSVVIIGVGGVGSLIAEILARCGVGKLILIDFDTVEEVNLNRLFYEIKHIGLQKVTAAREVLQEINPSIDVEIYSTDVCAVEFEKKFEELLKESDLAFSCLDNLPARLYINQKNVKTKREYVDCGASRSGLGGYIHFIHPHISACYACTGTIDLGLKKESAEPCTASLPTTIAMIAALATETALKYFLNFGNIADYLGFNALTDNFIHRKMQKDPNCYICGEKKEYTKKEKEESYEKITKLTENKSVEELIDDLQDEEKSD